MDSHHTLEAAIASGEVQTVMVTPSAAPDVAPEDPERRLTGGWAFCLTTLLAMGLFES